MRGKTVNRTCKCCGDPFTARQADVNRGWAKFCSKRCKAIKQEARTGRYRAYRHRDFDVRDFDVRNFDNTEHQDHE